MFRDGPRIAVTARGSINGGKARKPSVILIIISSVLLLARPETMPIGTPTKTEKKTTPKAILNEDRAARIVIVNTSLPDVSVPNQCDNEGACPAISK